MYPNLYFAFKDIFGVDWPALRFINSFGFFVAISFLISSLILAAELKRKSSEGLLRPTESLSIVGEPATFLELFFNFLLGFVAGYKILGLLFMAKTATEDPQAFIFSTQGNWFTGILLGLVFAYMKWAEKNKQKLDKPEKRIIRIWPHDRVGEIVILALIFGLLGAKLFDIFEDWDEFLKAPADYIFSPAGLTFYGGLICAAIAIWIFARKHSISFWHLNDAAAPALMLAYSIGRIGCQVAGDGDWGIENNFVKPNWIPQWMWSFTYPHNVANMGKPIVGCEGKFCNQLPHGVFPTPFYETIICALLFVLIWMYRKKFKIPGTLFSFYLILNGLERFFIEKIRVNVKMNFFGFHPTQAELISASFIIIGIILWVYLTISAKRLNRYQNQQSINSR